MENGFRGIESEKFKENGETSNESRSIREFSNSFDRQNNERDSLSNAGVQDSIRRNNKIQKEIYSSRDNSRNYNWNYYNPTLETLRHLAYVMQNMTYIGLKRNIRGCYSGDLSKQARREWAILHRNSDGFDWEEDDFEI